MVPISLGMARSHHDGAIGMRLRRWEVISHPSPLSSVPITVALSSETPADKSASILQRSPVAHSTTCTPQLPSRSTLQHAALKSTPGQIYSCNYITPNSIVLLSCLCPSPACCPPRLQLTNLRPSRNAHRSLIIQHVIHNCHRAERCNTQH